MTDIIRQGITWVPMNATWQEWNGNMLHYFGEEPIPYLPDEKDWKIVANAIVGLPTFMVYSPPDPDAYEDCETWALTFRTAVNGPTQ